jgi:hypothetical protein
MRWADLQRDIIIRFLFVVEDLDDDIVIRPADLGWGATFVEVLHLPVPAHLMELMTVAKYRESLQRALVAGPAEMDLLQSVATIFGDT